MQPQPTEALTQFYLYKTDNVCEFQECQIVSFSQHT